MVVALLGACGNEGNTGDAGNENGGSYQGEVTSAASGGPRNDQVMVGVGDNSHYPPPYLTVAAGHQVTAECHGPAEQPPHEVTVTTTDGWKIQLTYGSQTITAENPNIEAPPGQLTTPQHSIDYSKSPDSIYTWGINWDKPAKGHIEIQINQDEAPPEWGRSPEFKMYMHINCGGAPDAAASSSTEASR